jgi:hypothetical protein
MATVFFPEGHGDRTPQQEVKHTVDTLLLWACNRAMNRLEIYTNFDSDKGYKFAYFINRGPKNIQTIACRKIVKQTWEQYWYQIQPKQNDYRKVCRIYVVDDPIEDNVEITFPKKEKLNELTYYIEMYDPISGNRLYRKELDHDQNTSVPEWLEENIYAEILKNAEVIKTKLTTNAQWIALAQIIQTIENL